MAILAVSFGVLVHIHKPPTPKDIETEIDLSKNQNSPSVIKLAMPSEFDPWFKELAAAYEANDMQKVGTLIEAMDQKVKQNEKLRQQRLERREKARSRTTTTEE